MIKNKDTSNESNKWVACYCRVSTDEQAREGISIHEQQNRLQAYCISQGWNNYKFYIDDGYSAKNIKRPQLQKLLNDGEQNNISTVLVTKIDRFTRRLKDMLDLHKKLEGYNISFCSASESFDTSTAVGRMMLQILTMFAEFERERISERVTDNMLFNAKNGKIQQPPCFGYDLIKDEVNEIKMFVINKEEAKWAIQIFKLYVEENWGYMKIAKYLNQNNVKTKQNKEWSAQGVKVYLSNKLLTGEMTWYKRNTKDEKWKMRDESEWKITENACESIIPVDLWYNAQTKLSLHQPRGTQNSPYLLTGMIRCGHCESSMVSSRSRVNKKKGTHEHTYLCSKYRQGQGCICNWVLMDEIDSLVLNEIIEMLKEKSLLNIKDDNTSINIESLEIKLIEIKKSIDFQLQLLELKEITLDEFRVARQRINKEKEKIENQIKLSNSSKNNKLISAHDDILPILQDDKCSKEQKREKLKKIIEKIVIFDKGKTPPDIILKEIE